MILTTWKWIVKLVKTTGSLAHAMNHLAPSTVISFVLNSFFSYCSQICYATHVRLLWQNSSIASEQPTGKIQPQHHSVEKSPDKTINTLDNRRHGLSSTKGCEKWGSGGRDVMCTVETHSRLVDSLQTVLFVPSHFFLPSQFFCSLWYFSCPHLVLSHKACSKKVDGGWFITVIKWHRGHQWRAFPWITATLICIGHNHNSYRAIS